MSRDARIGWSFCLISAAYLMIAMPGLSALVMSHCVLSDVQIAAGQTCDQPADRFFWPAVIAALVGFVVVQRLFLRWVVRTIAVSESRNGSITVLGLNAEAGHWRSGPGPDIAPSAKGGGGSSHWSLQRPQS